MDISSLFPADEHGKRVILPTQKRILSAPARGIRYLCVVGGFGSGKTRGACALGVALSLSIAGNRGIILRRTYDLLAESTQLEFLNLLQEASIPYEAAETRFGLPRKVIFPNKSEVLFRESKNPGRYLGSQYGWFLCDEAREEPAEFFAPRGIRSRLRLPHAARDGCLIGILITNPPPSRRHWVVQHFGSGDGIREVTDEDTGRSIRYEFVKASSRENIFLPPDYIFDLTTGCSPEEIARIIDGEIGYGEQAGIAAFPQFAEQHLAEVDFESALPLYLGWDFGFRHPAVSAHQFYRCKAQELHWNVIAEVDAERVESLEFAIRVFRYLRQVFPGLRPEMVVNAGDRQGAYKTDRGPGPITRLSQAPFYLLFRYKYCDVEPGLEFIRTCLRQQCACGRPRFQIHPRCENLLSAFRGEYHYPKEAEKRENPVKDGFFDDFVDSLRYAAENFFRQLVAGLPLDEAPLPEYQLEAERVTSPWEWNPRNLFTSEQSDAEKEIGVYGLRVQEYYAGAGHYS